MPRFADIIGHELAISALKRSIRNESVAHAYLFTGSPGVGKMTTALAFASSLNCVGEKDGEDACGKCWSCRGIDAQQHADLTVLSPMGAGDVTGIEPTRELIHSFRFGPAQGKRKIAIIEKAETLNAESANCLLKTLEEPPDYVIMILLSSNPALLLETIKSRCQRLRMVPAPIPLLQQRLIEKYDVETEHAAFLASYSEGRPGRAISLVGNADFFETRNAVVELAGEAAAEGSRWKMLRLAQTLRELAEKEEEAGTPRKRLISTLDALVIWYRDLLTVKLIGENAPVVNSDRREELLSQASSYKSSKRLASSLTALTRVKKYIGGNANIQIATESIMIALTR